jgi:hypothetical protein
MRLSRRGEEAEMAVAAKAGVLYALAAFLIGFVIGAIRVTLIVPRLGETAAVCLEAPICLPKLESRDGRRLALPH